MEHWGHATTSMCVHTCCLTRRHDIAMMSVAVPCNVVLLLQGLQIAHIAQALVNLCELSR